jgi:hypothetical protein
MIWIKSTLVGLAGAVVATVLVVAATLAWMINVQIGEGSGGIGAVSLGIIEIVFLPAFLGFALGFWLTVRRERRKRGRSAV